MSMRPIPSFIFAPKVILHQRVIQEKARKQRKDQKTIIDPEDLVIEGPLQDQGERKRKGNAPDPDPGRMTKGNAKVSVI